MSNNPSPKKPGWKKGGPEKAPAGPARAWKREPGAAGAPAGTSRKVKLLASLTGFFILLALLFWFIQWLLAGKKTALVLIAAGYETNLSLPQNAPGRHAVDALRELADKGDPNNYKNFTAYSSGGDFKHKADWQPAQKLAELNENVLLMVFSVHGVSDGTRNYLLRDGGSPWDMKEHLGLEEVLSVLEGVSGGKKKVLVLDVVHVLSHWPTGQIQNDFVRNLKQLNDRIKNIKNLVVLCSTDVDQRSWQSPEWGRSVYLHYLLEGLKGAADGNKHGQVTALELHDFLAARTKRWVFDNRATLQTPLLFPDGEEGRKRAEDINLAATVAHREPDKIAPGGFKAESLREVWSKWAALRNEQPAPWSYAPHLWKLYSQALLRHEELTLYGSSFAAAARTEAEKYHNALAGLRQITLEANGYALPLSAVGGVSAAKPLRDSVKEVGARLRADATPETWNNIRKQMSPADLQLLVQELHRSLLKEFINNARDLRSPAITGMLQRLEMNRGVRPIEVHFARMLSLEAQFAERDTTDKSNLILEALRHRVRAEEIALAFDADNRRYPYAEHIRPWIADRLAVTDEVRRHAEDWLFANKWETATGEYVNKVESQYKNLEEDVKRLRQALAMRDQGLAELPWFSHGVAILDPSDEGKSSQQLAELQKLWENLHDLDQALSVAPNPNPQALNDQITRMHDLAGQVRQGLDKLQQEYRQQVNSLLNEKDTPRNLHDLFALTAVPYLDGNLEVEKRLQLAQKVRGMSGTLLRSTETSDTNDTKIDSSGAAKDFPLKARQRVARQGRLLMATVGQYNMQGEFATYNRFGSPTETIFTEAAAAGPRVRAAWQRLGEDTDLLLKGLVSASRDKCRQDLLRAERLGRHLSVASAPQFANANYNPGALARQMRLYDLLVWMARRTQQDFWNWEIKQANPYYVDAARRYLADASKRLSELPEAVTPKLKEERSEEIKSLEALLDSKPKLALDGLPSGTPPTLHITSELEYDLGFRLKVHKDVPRGFPYTTFVIKEPDLLTQNVQEKRSVAKVEKETDEVPLQLRLNNLLLTDTTTKLATRRQEARCNTEVKLSSWFRGHIDDPTINVVMYPFANNVQADEPPVAGTGLTVYGKNLKRFSPNNSALVIVLDCSGSMGEERTKDASGQTRFVRTKGALRRLLQSIQDDTRVSLWIYGQSTPVANRSGKPVGQQVKALEEGAEGTIHRLVDPMKWRQSMTDSVMAKVDGITTASLTPITRSILEARADLAEWESDPTKGFATLIVLTDGEDTCFKSHARGRPESGDPIHNPDSRLEIADFLGQKLRDSRINYHVIGYQLNDQERKVAQGQFGALQGRPDLRFTLEFDDDVEQLVRRLIERSQQRLKYTIKEGIQERIVKQGNLQEIRPLPEPLPPGNYQVLVHGPRTYSQKVRLDNGDSLTLRVVEDKGDLKLVRDALTEEYKERPQLTLQRQNTGEHWQLTNLRNRRDDKPPSQAVLVTLERLDQAGKSGDEDLTVMGPGFVWMELKGAQSEKNPFRLQWGRSQGWPAPTWAMNAAWASPTDLDAASQLLIWVSTARPQAESGTLEKGIHWNLGRMGNPAPRPAGADRILNGKVKIESVRLETHLIKFGPDDRAEKRECLVVRASYEGEPVFVEPQGFKVPALHQYYTDARKYTGYFILPHSQAETVTQFNLFALEMFKKHAQTLHGTLKLEKPRPGDVEPESFQRIKNRGEPGS